MQYLLVVMFSSSPQIKNFTCSGIRIIDIRFGKFNVLSNIFSPQVRIIAMQHIH